MFDKLANIFRIPDLRKRILFTLGLLFVYRLGGHIPTPGVNADKLAQFFEQNRGSFLGFDLGTLVGIQQGQSLKTMIASAPIRDRGASRGASN